MHRQRLFKQSTLTGKTLYQKALAEYRMKGGLTIVLIATTIITGTAVGTSSKGVRPCIRHNFFLELFFTP